MPLATRISNAAAIAAANAIVDLVDAGSGAGYVQILDGAQPAGVDVAIGAQNVLSQHTMSDPAYGNATDGDPGGVATANAIADDTSANATGTAAWFRQFDSDGTPILDGSVGTATSNMIIDSVAIVAGQTVKVNSCTVTMPES